ncbi:MAG: MafI family immunity protein [Alphaproteobacteria bacterium]
MKKRAEYYLGLEKALEEILEIFHDKFSESRRQDIREFIDVGEYGLALETLVSNIQDDAFRNVQEVARILELADIMQIRSGKIICEFEERQKQ